MIGFSLVWIYKCSFFLQEIRFCITGFAFSRGPGRFRELREAGRNHVHLSRYRSASVVTNNGSKSFGGEMVIRGYDFLIFVTSNRVCKTRVMQAPKCCKITTFQPFESETIWALCCFPMVLCSVSAFQLRNGIRTDAHDGGQKSSPLLGPFKGINKEVKASFRCFVWSVGFSN